MNQNLCGLLLFEECDLYSAILGVFFYFTRGASKIGVNEYYAQFIRRNLGWGI